MQRSLPFITVIVPVYNGRDFLPRCLDALFSSDYASFEVLVVNDGSTDDGPEIAAQKGARVISTDHRSGPGAARNLAAEVAAGEILVFVDADVVVKHDTLRKFGENFVQLPEVSAIFGSYDDEPAEQNFLSQYKNLQHHFVHQNSERDASTFWSGLGAIRRGVFIAHGGFDCEKYSIPSIEDIDLGYRLRRSGHQILLDRSIQAKHLKRWELISHLRTEIFCRALPWSRLILEENRIINDMNVKTGDRISAMLVALLLLSLPFIFWKPIAALIPIGCLLGLVYLNREILAFYARKRGVLFAALTFPWQLLYFFYSGVVFSYCWVRYALPHLLGFTKEASAANCL